MDIVLKPNDFVPKFVFSISLEDIQDLHSMHGYSLEKCVDIALESVKMELVKTIKERYEEPNNC